MFQCSNTLAILFLHVIFRVDYYVKTNTNVNIFTMAF